MVLYHLDAVREESNEDLIEIALRKGWKERPNPPECSDDQISEWNWEKESWEILPKPVIPETFETELDKGFFVEKEGFYIGMQEHDRNQWTALRSQLLDGLSMERLSMDTPIIIWDIEGTPKEVAVRRLREILFDSGVWYIQLKAKYANL